MAKFRMVPDDLPEARLIASLFDEYVDRNSTELAGDPTKRARLRELLNGQERWHEIVTDLEDEDDGNEPAVKAAPPAKAAPAARAADVKPAGPAPKTTEPAK